MKRLGAMLLAFLFFGCESPTAPLNPCEKQEERDRGRHKAEKPNDCLEWIERR